MKQTTFRSRDPLARTALGLYVGPRFFVLVVLAAVLLLAGFLVFAQFARNWLVGVAV